MPLNLVVNKSSSCCFDPDAIERLTAAYEGACAELHVPSNGPSLKEIVAKKIIEHAQRGERDPLLLRDVVVAELRLEAISGS
jgi:hypothetical protein